MITRITTLSSWLGLALAFLFTLAACGGGGGGGGGGFIPDDPVEEPVTAYEVSLTLVDPDGNPTNTITSTIPATLLVEVIGTLNLESGPVADLLITATTDLATLLPASGTALTDADGVATFQVQAGATLGAGTIEITFEGDEGPVTATINYQVAPADLRVGRFEDSLFINGELSINPEVLSSEGSALVSVAVVDEDDQRVETAEQIRFSSGCSINGLADLPDSATTANGQVNVTYTATGCAGQDTITATLAGTTSQATGTVTIASPEVNSIVYQSATPLVIALRGTGGPGRSESSDVQFLVADATGNPIQGETVHFSLSTDVGGLSLANDMAVTGPDGLAKAVVQSGDVATPVRVFATINTTDENGNPISLSTVSDELAISTGLPDQNSFSLSASENWSVARGADIDGITKTIIIRMADKFNHPVPDGTTALFFTEYGTIEPSCTTAGGTCTVIWTSQAPRMPLLPENQELIMTTDKALTYDCPSHNGLGGPCPDDLGGIYGMRSTVTAIAIGEESFNDQNANGVYNENEPFVNLPEAFRDDNEDGVHTPTQGPNCPEVTSEERCIAGGADEIFMDFNSNEVYDLNVDPNTGEGVYNGVLCPVEGDDVFCSRDLLNVRADGVLTLHTENLDILLVRVLSGQIVGGTFEGREFVAYIADVYNNPPAAGSSISISGSAGCSVITESSVVVPPQSGSGAFAVPVQTTGTGTLTISAGNTVETFSCDAPDPPDPNAPGFSPGP